MGREIRKVPQTWEHPKDDRGRHVPLFDGDGLAEATERWDRDAAAWARGEFPDYASAESKALPFEEWDGKRPDPADYMPVWTPGEATHFQMYETCSEGTPISPVLASPVEVARWCADNGASAFGDMTQSFRAWLSIAGGESSVGALFTTQADGSILAMPDAEARIR